MRPPILPLQINYLNHIRRYGTSICLTLEFGSLAGRPQSLVTFERSFQVQHLPGRGQRLPALSIVPPGIFLLERQVFACRGDGPLRTALQRAELVPADRHRDTKTRPGASRERGSCRLAVAVAQVVDEDLAHAVEQAFPPR